MVELRLLGSPLILCNGRAVDGLTAAKSRALLYYLAVTNRPQSRLALASLFWPEKGDADARTNLRQAVHTLRQWLPTQVLATREGVRLAPDAAILVDVLHFEAQVQAGLAGDLAALQRAVELYQGEFLHGFYIEEAVGFEEWQLVLRERLHTLATQALAYLALHYEKQAAPRLGLLYANRLLMLEPWREETHCQVMRLLATDGQPQAALAHYHRCCQLLQQELGVEPDATTVALIEQIRTGQWPKTPEPSAFADNHSHPGAPPAPEVNENHGGERSAGGSPLGAVILSAPHEPAPTPLRHNLPAALTTFIGRQRDLLTIQQRLTETPPQAAANGRGAGSRLLTLTGPGGVGKTRLALAVAQAILDAPTPSPSPNPKSKIQSLSWKDPNFPDGLWFVDLAPLQDPALVPQAVAALLTVREEAQRPLVETLCEAVRTRHLLLILDNCEHLLAACARLAQRLLQAAPQLKILATSREPLHLGGELHYRVPPLAWPDPQNLPALSGLLAFDAVRLLVDRATLVQPAFVLTADNAAALVEICRRLDGIPLALELVAARVKLLTVHQIAERLGRDGESHFRLVARTDNVPLRRHQTLLALIEWSYNLLTAKEQTLLRRLAGFVGSWSLPAAETICADEAGPDAMLTESDILDLLGSLVDKSLVIVEPAGAEMRYRLLESIRQFGLGKLKAAQEECQQARRHLHFYLTAIDTLENARPDLDKAERLAQLHWEVDNVRAALHWARRHDPEAGLRLALLMGTYWFARGGHRESLNWLRTLLAAQAGVAPTVEQVNALSNAGFAEWWLFENYPAAHELLTQALNGATALVLTERIEAILNNLGGVALRQGDSATALAYLQRGLALATQSGNQHNQAWSLLGLGEAALLGKDYEAAQRHFRAAEALMRTVSMPSLLAYPLRRLGQIAALQQDDQTAARYYQESLDLNLAVGEPEGSSACLVAYAGLWLARGDCAGAIALCAVADTLLQVTQTRLSPYDRRHYDAILTNLRKHMSATNFSAAWAVGVAMPLAEAVRYSKNGQV